MAKAKKETDVIEEVTVKKVVAENAAEDTEAVKEAEKTERFIARKLTAINSMDNSAKAQRLAERVLMNRKG